MRVLREIYSGGPEGPEESPEGPEGNLYTTGVWQRFLDFGCREGTLFLSTRRTITSSLQTQLHITYKISKNPALTL